MFGNKFYCQVVQCIQVIGSSSEESDIWTRGEEVGEDYILVTEKKAGRAIQGKIFKKRRKEFKWPINHLVTTHTT